MILKILWGLLLVMCASGTAAAASTPRALISNPIEIAQGEIVEVTIPADGIISLEAKMGKEPVYFFPEENGDFSALIGADVEAKPGLVKISLRSATASGASRERQIGVRIKAKAFKKESVTVPAEFDQFTPELLQRIRREQGQFARVYRAATPKRFWELPFVTPVPVEITSPFGYRRIINGTPRSPHTGTDLRAAMGTEVKVSNDGRVVLTGDFYFAGRSVVVDHGAGLFTMYFHLSQIKAEEGAEVHKGEVIGLSGMSGRVTGPHLHWGALLNGSRVDPLALIDKLGGNGKRSSPADQGNEEK
jgi:murein DD-endopeptidase MepM/ murein hydrolase activator NlpD